MKRLLAQYRSFDRPIRLLLLNQFTINLGFFMLIPYLAAHLSGDLGMAAGLVGLVLGLRNFSQQGMFLLGGSLADRFGYKPSILAGCLLRTGGFVLLGFSDSLPVLLIASVATGFAGALFNPAVRAYVAADAGPRRVEAFAVFNVFYQTGMMLGPLIGLALTGFAFRWTCLTAAVIFAVLTVLQWRALPARRAGDPGTEAVEERPSLRAGWRTVLGNTRFVAFALALAGAYVLSYQMYLVLPLELGRNAPTPLASTVEVGLLFTISGLMSLAGQLHITDWCRAHWTQGQCLTRGLALMGLAFIPPALAAVLGPTGGVAGNVTLVAALAVCTALLSLGTIISYPFQMDTIVTLARGSLVATHYGLYNTICGIGITLGNLAAGSALDLAHAAGLAVVPWLALGALGGLCTVAIRHLDRAGRLQPHEDPTTPRSATPETADGRADATNRTHPPTPAPVRRQFSGTLDQPVGQTLPLPTVSRSDRPN